jgi:hypothetical protein
MFWVDCIAAVCHYTVAAAALLLTARVPQLIRLLQRCIASMRPICMFSPSIDEQVAGWGTMQCFEHHTRLELGA